MNETIDRTPVDKTAWGPGPWQHEPDRVEFAHAGLPCLALRNHYGVWCGYVAVPPSHPLHGTDYNTVDVDVHGGLTYASTCAANICHVPASGEPADVWWMGFDCYHSGDFSPDYHARTRHLGPPFDAAAYDHSAAVMANTSLVDTYRDLPYVEAEIKRLAEQLAARALTLP